MKIIKLLPGKEPRRIEVENTLEALQNRVEQNASFAKSSHNI